MELTIKYKDGTEEQVELEDIPLKEGEHIFKVGNKWYLKKMEYKKYKSENGKLVELLKGE